ncbi:hypothetical protein ABIE32_001752 [Comamonas sp. 4034]
MQSRCNKRETAKPEIRCDLFLEREIDDLDPYYKQGVGKHPF